MTIKSSERYAGSYNASHFVMHLSRRRVRQLSIHLTVGVLLLVAADSWSKAEAQAIGGKVVGLGTATCQRFNDDVKSNAILRRDYMAWAQGFMSGMLASQPGADNKIVVRIRIALMDSLLFRVELRRRQTPAFRA